MKNLLIANISSSNRYKGDKIKTLINAQVENSLELGWKKDDIILISNFDYNFMGVRSTKTNLNKNCLTGSKMFGLKFLLDLNLINDVIWAHDLDAWQNVPFLCPDFKEVGISCYSTGKYNGGSIFWRTSAKDIASEVINRINNKKENKEEPTLNKVLKSKKYKDRVTALNHTYNVGCSAYVVRWNRSIKPLRVCHFHPYNNTAWETHCLDRNGLDEKGITDRLEKLIRKHYPDLSTELSDKGKKAQAERKKKRLSEVII